MEKEDKEYEELKSLISHTTMTIKEQLRIMRLNQQKMLSKNFLSFSRSTKEAAE